MPQPPEDDIKVVEEPDGTWAATSEFYPDVVAHGATADEARAALKRMRPTVKITRAMKDWGFQKK